MKGSPQNMCLKHLHTFLNSLTQDKATLRIELETLKVIFTK